MNAHVKFVNFILIFLVISSYQDSLLQAQKYDQNTKTEFETARLHFVSGVRAFLEDSHGNTWFGSDREGACMLREGIFTYFTTENGLSNNQVRNIYEDESGIIWFECGRGLSTYDGQKMKVYTERNFLSYEDWELSGTDLWFMSDPVAGYSNRHGDRDGRPGILHYNKKGLTFRSFPVPRDTGDVFNNSVSTRFIKLKNGTFWIGTYSKVIGYNGTDFSIISNEYLRQNGVPGSMHVRDIMEDSHENLWIANNGSGILKYNGKEIINFTSQNKLSQEDTKGNSLEKAFSIGEDSFGNIWFGTSGSGVWRFDGKTVENFSKEDGLESNHIWTIYKTKSGELWFGGASPSGVFMFNGKTFERKY
ncbi:MAG: hypothetical protein H6567_12195 [Lewinellaceae bacterium]|nr:hypothetical protein [Lewinellaceae bacterium]